jgi:hypothetical protein
MRPFLLELEVSPCINSVACSLGLSATSQQYFSLTTNQPPANSQQYFSLRTNQHQPSATSQPNRLQISSHCGMPWSHLELTHVLVCDVLASLQIQCPSPSLLKCISASLL